MQITQELIEAIVVCRDFALKAAGTQVLKHATVIENFIQELAKEHEQKAKQPVKKGKK